VVKEIPERVFPSIITRSDLQDQFTILTNRKSDPRPGPEAGNYDVPPSAGTPWARATRFSEDLTLDAEVYLWLERARRAGAIQRSGADCPAKAAGSGD
jgi:hypothetical protein